MRTGVGTVLFLVARLRLRVNKLCSNRLSRAGIDELSWMKIVQIRGRMRSPYDGLGAVPRNKSMKVDTLRNNAMKSEHVPGSCG
jgi:hypothetical protein